MAAVTYDSRHFAQIVALAADAIICVDHDQNITLFNHGAEVAFGYAPEEALGRPLTMLIPERFRGGHAAQVRSFSRGAPVARHMGERGIIHALRKNGQEFPAEATISRTGPEGDEVLTVILRDVTNQMLLRGQLESMVADRTRALEQEIEEREKAQAQLLRIQRLEAFGQLTGGIAHDFNNLLTVIGGNLELLQERLPPGAHSRPLDRALDAVAMGGRLTQRLLSFARRSRLDPEILDINAEVVAIIELLRRSLGEAVTVSSILAPRLWTVKADASQVENAILNLAINARDAMPQGGKLIIETANATIDAGFAPAGGDEPPSPGDYVRISISDTGTGMEPAVLARAFEPFFTTKEPGKGTGLGLASTYGFARQSGGLITLYSEVGAGTTVNLYLPRAGAADGAAEEDEPARAAPAAAGRRILLVEDNAGVRETTIDRLEGLGHAVTACEDARSAMDLLERGEVFDLVFSDVVMPGGLSGLELADWIARTRPGLPVLLTSGFTGELLKGHDAGRPDRPFLRKPYGRAELSAAIEAALQPAHAEPRALL